MWVISFIPITIPTITNMAQAPDKVVVSNLAGGSFEVRVAKNATVADLMFEISRNYELDFDGFLASPERLFSNMRLGVMLPIGLEKMGNPYRTLASYGVVDGTEVFVGMETIEVWNLLFDFLLSIYYVYGNFNIVGAEMEFDGIAMCAHLWDAMFQNALEHPNERDSQLILGVCYQYNPGNVIGFTSLDCAMDYYIAAADRGCPYARAQCVEFPDQYLVSRRRVN